MKNGDKQLIYLYDIISTDLQETYSWNDVTKHKSHESRG